MEAAQELPQACRLHDVLRPYAESSLAALARPASVTEQVRDFVLERLAQGSFGLDDAARKLRMSSRTLGRRLADEGSSFKQLLDETRRTVSLRHVAGHDLSLGEVAQLAGFTETPSFYRAFRRWTNTTPRQYRRNHRAGARALL